MHFTNSTPILDNGDALRERAATDGYLFFRGLLPAEAILPVRANLLSVVRQHGWLTDEATGTLDVAALAAVPESAMRTDIGVSAVPPTTLSKSSKVSTLLPHHPKLLALYQTLFVDEVLVHARHIIRMISPHPAVFPTPPHQDFPADPGHAEHLDLLVSHRGLPTRDGLAKSPAWLA